MALAQGGGMKDGRSVEDEALRRLLRSNHAMLAAVVGGRLDDALLARLLAAVHERLARGVLWYREPSEESRKWLSETYAPGEGDFAKEDIARCSARLHLDERQARP